MARSVIPLLPDQRRNGAPSERARSFSYVLRAIALGRLPGEQILTRKAMLSRLLASFIMSIVLWYYVTDQENPIVRSQPYHLQVVVVNVPKGLALLNGATSVTVTARGLQDAVNSSQQIVPVVDLAGVSRDAREATVKVTLQGGRHDVQYTVVPPTLSLRLEPLVSAQVPVQFVAQSSLPINLSLASQRLAPPILTISGPAYQVNRVSYATVGAPLSSLAPPNPQVSSFPFTFFAVPQLFDRNGGAVSANGLLPATTRVKVTLQINVNLAIKALTVVPPNISAASLPDGYQLDSITPDPLTVLVVGSPDAVNPLSAVPTLPISLLGITHSTTVTTHLDLGSLPPDVTVYSQGKGSTGTDNRVGPKWSMIVTISKQIANMRIPASVIVDNLGQGLQAQTDPLWTNVYVTGFYLDMKQLGPLVARVNALGLGPGVYTLRPTVSLPKSLASYVSPPTIRVTITQQTSRQSTGTKSTSR